MSIRSRISIIIPYYRKKKYFQETIKSILNQTYKNYEVIVIYDDASVPDIPGMPKTLRVRSVSNRQFIKLFFKTSLFFAA